MKKYLLTLSIIGIIAHSFAQTSCNIKKAYAYFKVNVPGTIIANDKSIDQPAASIERVIYVECIGTKIPVVDSVFYNNISFVPTITAVNEIPLNVGKNFENGKDIFLTPQKGNHFIKISLKEAAGKALNKHYIKNIRLKTKSGKYFCTTYLNKESELMAEERN